MKNAAGIIWFVPVVAALLLCMFSCEPGEGGEMKNLPKPVLKGRMSVEEAVRLRRSVRSFKSDRLSLEQISQLCWVAQGVTDEKRGFRSAPSAGATYPLELYLLTADGVFRYLPERHALEQMADTDRREELARAALNQRFVAQAPAVFVFTAVLEGTARRYGRRAARYVHMEVGHASQNIHIQAVALGLGSVPVGAFDDEAVTDTLELAGGEVPLYIVPVGVPAR